MDWDDVRYLLERTYLQGRSFHSSLLNRENGLNLSTNGMLAKTSTGCLVTQRKLVQLASDVHDTVDCDNVPEQLLLAELLDLYSNDHVHVLAKTHNYPAAMGQKTPTTRQFTTECEQLVNAFVSQLTLSFESVVDRDAVSTAVSGADELLASIHEEYVRSRGPTESPDDVGSLARSVRDASLVRSGFTDPSGPGHSISTNSTVNSTTAAPPPAGNPFVTARQALVKNAANRPSAAGAHSHSSTPTGGSGYNPAVQARRLLGGKRRFADPKPSEPAPYRDEGRDINTEFSYYNMKNTTSTANTATGSNKPAAAPRPPPAPSNSHANASPPTAGLAAGEEPVDERLAGIEPRIIEMIRNEIMHKVDNITWDSIAGLEHAKNSIKEIVVWPMLRPDIFKGLRGPPKGLLLFGPPGTGKTMIGKCIASQAGATFFSISASSLTSKWVGEGEKMVRALFAVARCSQPAVIFIDEIDSLLTQRTDGEFEASRRIKTEFLVQFDGAGTSSEDRILVIGATNRPQEIDEAARRRLVKRLYIPLPDPAARATIIRTLMNTQSHSLDDTDIDWICARTDGYSGSDMDGLCREAAIGPIRSISDILNISTSDVRPIQRKDFEEALTQVRASVSNQDLDGYLEWNRQFGSLSVKCA